MASDSTSSSEQAGQVHVDHDGPILRLTLDRTDTLNALSPPMVTTLVDELTDAAHDDSLRAVHIVGAGSNFCGGADWVSTNRTGGPRPRAGNLVRRVPHQAHRIIELVHGLHLPVVCTVRGWAVGLGCNLALAADFTIAADDATFWEPFVARGFSPDSGATWLVPRLAGIARAKQMLMLGEKVGASDACDWGLIYRSTPPSDVDAAASALLDRLASGPTVALGLAKQAINGSHTTSLPEAMNQELYALELACRTDDFKSGLKSFKERTVPEFHGR
ncbi:enoyl-CoA hydratase/isomerase family protein [Rhodococcus artemisiae]|uniref:Enoyl-CoA hydratase-related protein n=1 Tax=Rhodococcus artemisiae TaxID=714159 RepID=A0ABU7LAI7_9NOCA|nr:enoyl-CoA hydratase-related protein [Rhodococcus artemisiae]MEE2058540.1 enoyl-CoA hydratase-related protein [Rhodococcus artemisiae]